MSESQQCAEGAGRFTRTEVYRLEGQVVHGFGRGSKLLGFPTANLDPTAFKSILTDVPRGVYFGWAKIIAAPGQPAVDSGVYKAFVSLGTNPQFQTVEDTAEAYIFNDYGGDFYGQTMQLLICGHIRAMCAFDSLDALIAAINNDVKIGSEALDAEDLASLKGDSFFNAQPAAAAAE